MTHASSQGRLTVVGLGPGNAELLTQHRLLLLTGVGRIAHDHPVNGEHDGAAVGQ